MKFLVTVPDNLVRKSEFREYIRSSIQSWKGCFHPEDELFSLRPQDVKVAYVKDEPVVTQPYGIGWRPYTDADKKFTQLSRCKYENKIQEVAWNHDFDTWGLANAIHILVRVDEIYARVKFTI